MASKAPPPLIRSSKAFSVEIPEGSNSAKAKRSDVVANDDLTLTHQPSHFETETGLSSASGQFKEVDLADRFGPGEGDLHPDQQTGLVKEHGTASRQALGQEPAHTDNLQGIAQDSIRDNLQDIAQDSIRDNLQGIAQDSIRDNLQGIAQESIQDNLQDIAQDSIRDNLQGIAQDSIRDNLQGIAQDSIRDNLQDIAQDSIRDNLQDIAQDSIRDNLQDIAQDSFSNDSTLITEDPAHDRLPHSPADSLNSHVHRETSHAMDDHVVALPIDNPDRHPPGMDQGPLINPIAADHPAQTDHVSHNARQAQTPSHVSSASNAEMLHQAQIDKEKKLEAFHGRVEAIRKTVSGINHKLDELGEEPTGSKTKK